MTAAVLGVEKSLTSQFWAPQAAASEAVEAVARAAGVSEVVARVLTVRGVTPENVPFFMAPSFKRHLPDPYILRDMEKAAKRIADAVVNVEKIGVFGDYEVDGATS